MNDITFTFFAGLVFSFAIVLLLGLVELVNYLFKGKLNDAIYKFLSENNK